MGISKKTLKNNLKLSNNVSRMQSIFPSLRALVLKDTLEGLEELPVKDYYNIVILESDEALVSVAEPDYLILNDSSVYRDNLLYIDKYFGNDKVVFVTNYDAMHMFKKLKSTLNMFNVNYLPAGSGVSSTTPATANLTPSGLDSEEPGIHLAMVLGCTEIYYTGASDNAVTVTLSDITSFIDEKDPVQNLIPKNFVAINRDTVLNTAF